MRGYVTKRKVRRYVIQGMATLLFLFFFALFHCVEFLQNIPRINGYQVCIADCQLSLYHQFIADYLIYALILINFLFNIKNYFQYPFVMAFGSRKKLFFHQVKIAFWHSIGYSGIYTAYSYMISSFFNKQLFNWTELNSYFFICNKSILDINYFTIPVAIFLGMFLMCWIVLIEYLVLYWFLDSVALSWILIYLSHFLISRIIKRTIIVSLSAKSWISKTILQDFIAAVIYLVILLLIGVIAAKRKQIYKNKIQ